MAVDTATYVGNFNPALPNGTEMVSEGDDNIRQVKQGLVNSFPNVKGAVTADHTELSYMDGVTSPVQTQLDAKADITGETYSGTHNFTGATVTVPTATAGTNTTSAASTAFVQSAIAAVNAIAGVTVSTNSAASFAVTDGQIVSATNTGTVAVDFTATPTTGAVRGVHFDNGRLTNTIDFGSRSVMGPNGTTFSGVMTCNQRLMVIWRWFGDYWRAI